MHPCAPLSPLVNACVSFAAHRPARFEDDARRFVRSNWKAEAENDASNSDDSDDSLIFQNPNRCDSEDDDDSDDED